MAIRKHSAEKIQGEYYRQTARQYDAAHLGHGKDEHYVSLHLLSAMISLYSIESILDVGAGTGRAIEFISQAHPNVRIMGIEPVEELRLEGHRKGISESILIEGDGNQINFKDGDFDLVCEFGVLHHVPKPSLMVSEMLRVARRFIFISDSNNLGQGSRQGRLLKQGLHKLGLWRAYDYIRTRGRGYHISEGDGLFYSYSVFNNIKEIKKKCSLVHLMNTGPADSNLYASASHVALFGIKNT